MERGNSARRFQKFQVFGRQKFAHCTLCFAGELRRSQLRCALMRPNDEFSMASEIELKLEVSRAQLAKLARASWLSRYASGPGDDHRLDFVYYDTNGLSLRHRRAILHVRESGGLFTQTFKSESKDADGLSAGWSGNVR